MKAVELPSLDSYLAAAWSRRWRYLLVGALGAIMAIGAFLTMPLHYASTSSLALAPQVTYVGLSPSDSKGSFVTVDTVATLVDSDAVVVPVARAIGVSKVEARRRVTVTAQPLSSVLRIHVRANNAGNARLGSRVAAEALQREQIRLLSPPGSEVRLLRKRVQGLQAQALGRSNAGLDPSAVLDDVATLQQRLDEAVASDRASGLLLRGRDVQATRSGQVEVFATTGLAAGLAVLMLFDIARAPRGVRRP